MTTQTKAIIKSGLISGIVYAGLMVGFDYSDDKTQNMEIYFPRFIFWDIYGIYD